MIENNCMYCEKNKMLNKLMIPISEVDGFPLYLLRNQAYLGRTVLAYQDHVTKISRMETNKCTSFYLAVQKVTKVVQEIFEPGQINIGMFGDKVSHLHCHIVPKYDGELDWGSNFQLNPQPEKMLCEDEYNLIIEKIKLLLTNN